MFFEKFWIVFECEISKEREEWEPFFRWFFKYVHEKINNLKTIWDRDKVKIDAQNTMFKDDVYWFWHFNDEYFRRLRERSVYLKISDKNGV